MAELASNELSAIKASNGQTYKVRDVTRSAISVDGQLADVQMRHISNTDYWTLVATETVDPNTLYVVSSDYINAYGQQIKNALDPTDAQDAATKGYVDGGFAGVKIGYNSNTKKLSLSVGEAVSQVDCSDFIKDGMLSSAELSGTQLIFRFNTDSGTAPISVQLSSFFNNTQYYKKTETSSAQQISSALSGKQPVGNYLTAVPNTYKTYANTRASLSSDGYAVKSDVSAVSSALSTYYYKKTETSSSGQISTALSLKADLSAVGAKVYIDGESRDLSIIHMSKEDYDDLVAQGHILSNALYVVSGDYVDHIRDSSGNGIGADGQISSGGVVKTLATLDDIEEMQNRPGKYLLSSNGASSLQPAVVNVVTKARYMELSAAGQLSQTEIYAVDGNPFDEGSTVTVQHFNQAGGVATEQTDLSILCLTSMNQFRAMVADDQLKDNAIYKISSDYFSALGGRIADVADPSSSGDAVTLDYFEENNGAWRLANLSPVLINSAFNVWVNDHTVNLVDVYEQSSGQTLAVNLPAASWIDPQTGRRNTLRARMFKIYLAQPGNWNLVFQRTGESVTTKVFSSNSSLTTGGTYLIECVEIDRVSTSSTFAVRITKIS